VTIGDLLTERFEAIAERWVEEVLSSYPADAAALFQKTQDPFANPVGHAAREGTRGVLRAVLEGLGPDELRDHLDRIVRVRAVQDLTPSRALSFVFALRSVIRDAVPEAERDPGLRKELDVLDRRIDGVALAAFDRYAECREEVSRLRVNEVKRQVAWVFEKMNQRDAKAAGAREGAAAGAPRDDNAKREDPR
jgi:hypothetical protein